MAFQVRDKTLEWSHLASDLPLPTTLGKSARGGRSFELDTGKVYEFDGTNWYQISNSPFGGVAGTGDRTPAHTAPTATNVTSAMLAANTARKAALLVNDGATDVWIALGVAAVAHTGILLQANGGAFNMSDALGNLDNAAINGITASGTAVVLVTEWS